MKKAAEAEGLDQIFSEAGAEWREPGCSMCIAMNGDQLSAGQYCVSTTNRNFEGRQGAGGRTLLASPLTAAAAPSPAPWPIPRRLVEGGHGTIRTVKSRTVVLPIDNIDTDQIIPARFLKVTTRRGSGRLFSDWRYDASGTPSLTSS